jgi:hypothetical protein
VVRRRGAVGVLGGRLCFLVSIAAGTALWALFAAFDAEPWDSVAGWIAVTVLGYFFGYYGKGNALLWPLGILLGEILWGFGTLLYHSGGGANFFFPLGLIFLVPFTLPALFGSVIGALIARPRRVPG